jgi:hypothetical protein
MSQAHTSGRTTWISGSLALGSAAALALSVMSPAAADGHVVVDGLVSPLGFAIGSDGTFYVAEAFAGQLTSINKKGKRTTLVSGSDGQFTSGVDAKGRGTLAYTLSLPPEFADGPPMDTTLNRVLPNGRTRELASLLDYETSSNPDSGNLYGLAESASAECVTQAEAAADIIGPARYPGIVDSNPYAVAIDHGSQVVADAAGNDVVRVSSNGRVTTVGVLPPVAQVLTPEALDGLPLEACVGELFESDPVPTDVEIGPDGNYYVSALPGFPESAGAGKVFRITRSGSVTEVASGFTGAVDLAVAADGTIYVAELFGFQVSMVPPGESAATKSVFVPCPTAVEVGPDGTVYAAEGGICSDEGPPEEGAIVRVMF